MTEHFNKLTPAEAERLAFFIEECSEAIHMACKILRHGYASFDPTMNMGNPPINQHLLEYEIGHIRAAIRLMIESKDLSEAMIEHAADKKILSVAKWMHHQ